MVEREVKVVPPLRGSDAGESIRSSCTTQGRHTDTDTGSFIVPPCRGRIRNAGRRTRLNKKPSLNRAIHFSAFLRLARVAYISPSPEGAGRLSRHRGGYGGSALMLSEQKCVRGYFTTCEITRQSLQPLCGSSAFFFFLKAQTNSTHPPRAAQKLQEM